MRSKPYAIIPDRIWDGKCDTVQASRAVVVEGEKIAGVVPSGEIPSHAERIRLKGCTLIPGLIDAHVHYCAEMGPAYLAAGVTTVRDTGGELNWILEQRAENARELGRGPRIVCCGYALDGPRGLWQHMIRHHADAEEVRQSVREHVDRGVDAIKLYAFLDRAQYRAGVEEAHRLGMFVLAHIEFISVEEALEMGVDETEHQSGYGAAWKAATAEEDDTLIDRLLDHSHVMDPTLVVWDRFGRVLDRSFYHDRRREWVHPEYLRLWDRFPYRSVEPEKRMHYQRALPHLKRFLRRAHERGVTIAIGTDAPFIHLVPGFSLHDELSLYVDAGITPIDALRSATSVNAGVLGIDSSVGRIAPGLDADLAAVKGNPLERIDDVGNVVLTIRKGAMFKPADLLEATRAMFANDLDDPITRDLRVYAQRGEVID